MYRFGGIVYAFDWATAVLCLAASLLCSMGTTWASCRHELREVAAELMRPKSPKAGKSDLSGVDSFYLEPDEISA